MIKKKSKQREALMELLYNTKSHPSAEEIYLELKKTIPNISLGTVYRNLSQLAEANMILRLSVGDERDHFDGNTNPHYHMACEKCKKVIDLDMDPLGDLNLLAQKACGGEILNHMIVFRGKCKMCAEN